MQKNGKDTKSTPLENGTKDPRAIHLTGANNAEPEYVPKNPSWNIDADYLYEVADLPNLSQEEEMILAKMMEEGDDDARMFLVMAHLKLAIYIAKRYFHSETHFLDLVQEGNIAMLHASKEFDYRKGRFASFAVWPIWKAMTEYLYGQEWISKGQIFLLDRYKKAEETFEKQNGRKPTRTEIAKEMGLTEKGVADLELLLMSRNFASLEETIAKDGESGLKPFYQNDASPEESS